jgi:hypothetical protein
VALCRACEIKDLGVTTVEHRPWDRERQRHEFHFCDRCNATVEQKPLETVLVEYLE